MEAVTFPLPLNRRQMRELLRPFESAGVTDLVHTGNWVLERNDPDSVKSDLCAAWRDSVLPLRDWADDVRDVELMALYSEWEDQIQIAELYLVITLHTRENPIAQYAPYQDQHIDNAWRSQKHELPAILREILRTSPGIRIDFEPMGDPVGLANMDFLEDPLAWPLEYMKKLEIDPNDVADVEKGCLPVSHEHYLAEVAFTGWNRYLLGINGQLGWYTGGLCPECLPARASLNDLVEEYFKDPDSIYDPIKLGWVDDPYPKNDVQQRLHEIQEEISDVVTKLPQRAAIAVAIRCYKRFLEHEEYVVREQYREEYRAFHEGIVQLARDVACGKRPLVTYEERKEIGGGYTDFLIKALVDDLPYNPDVTPERARLLLADQVDKLPRRMIMGVKQGFANVYGMTNSGCFLDSVIQYPFQAVYPEYGHELGLLTEGQFEALHEQFRFDCRVIAEMNLGAEDTLGEPVPDAFLDRPLWRPTRS